MIAQIFAARFAQRTKTLAVIFQQQSPACHCRRHARCWRCSRVRRRIRHATSLSTTPSGRASSAARPTRFEDQVRAEAAESYDRNFHPWGISKNQRDISSGSLLRYDRRIVAIRPSSSMGARDADAASLAAARSREHQRRAPRCSSTAWAMTCPDSCGSRFARLTRTSLRPAEPVGEALYGWRGRHCRLWPS